MLNYRSVTNSELQVRSNPALRFVSPKSGFQERLSTLLEPTPLPFPTFQIVKEASKATLSQHPHHAWVRPAHLRAQWIVLADGLPLLLVDPKNASKLCSMRIPFDRRRVQTMGPIVLEGAWDHQDHYLWIWDVIVWEREIVWSKLNYSKRWDLVKRTVGEIVDCGHPMSDAQIRVPDWQTLEDVAKLEGIESGWSVEFQPEKAGMRRQLLVLKSEDRAFVAKTHHERKQIAEEAETRAKKEPLQEVVQNELVREVPKTAPKRDERRVARLTKDPLLKLPDTYRVHSVGEDEEDLGLSAIRSMEISKALRLRFVKDVSVLVDVMWYEPFQKWEVKQIHA